MVNLRGSWKDIPDVIKKELKTESPAALRAALTGLHEEKYFVKPFLEELLEDADRNRTLGDVDFEVRTHKGHLQWLYTLKGYASPFIFQKTDDGTYKSWPEDFVRNYSFNTPTTGSRYQSRRSR